MRASFLPGFFSRQSRLSREEKVRLFFSLLAPRPQATLLDVGGGSGQSFQQIWAFFSNVIVLDIDDGALRAAAASNPWITTLHADACDIPLADRSVDYVFSNAVIEHIPSSRRELFAKEIRRVVVRAILLPLPTTGSRTSRTTSCRCGNTCHGASVEGSVAS